MARDPQKFKLGVFVLSGIALLLGGIVILGAGSWFREAVTMYCYFDINVSGLEEGSQIRYRGVNIGVVDSVRLVPTGDPAMGKQASGSTARASLARRVHLGANVAPAVARISTRAFIRASSTSNGSQQASSWGWITRYLKGCPHD